MAEIDSNEASELDTEELLDQISGQGIGETSCDGSEEFAEEEAEPDSPREGKARRSVPSDWASDWSYDHIYDDDFWEYIWPAENSQGPGFSPQLQGTPMPECPEDEEGHCIVYGHCHTMDRNLGMLVVDYSQGRFQLGSRTGEFLKEVLPDDAELSVESASQFNQQILGADDETSAFRSADFKLLTLRQQLALLQARYARPGMLRRPWLPPYTGLQVSAIEAEHNVKFPPILRLYMENISRQQAIACQRTCFLSGYCDGWLDLEKDLPDPDSFIDDDGEPTYEPLTQLRLRGARRGFIWSNTATNWLNNFEQKFCWQPVFERLLHAAPTDISFPDKPSTNDTEGHNSSAANPGLGLPIDVPSALQHINCKPWELRYYVDEFKDSEEKTQMLIEKHLVPAAIRIQRQYRLWRWRMEVVFNPYTFIGNLNLQIKSRCAVREIDSYMTSRA